MSAKNRYFFIVTALFAISILAFSPRLARFEQTEPLDSIEVAEVQIEIGLAEFQLSAGNADALVSVDARYLEEYYEPELRVDRSGNEAFVYIASDEKRNVRTRDLDDADQRYDVLLNPDVEFSLRCEIGLGDNTFDLTDLKIRRFVLEAGLSETNITVDEPNAIEATTVKIESGLGELNTSYLGNLRFEELEYDGGLGEATIDLRGFEGEAEVSCSVGLGSLTLIIPEDVGVRLSYEPSFFSSVDLNGFERVRRGRYENDAWETSDSHIYMDLDVGMGSVDIRWR